MAEKKEAKQIAIRRDKYNQCRVQWRVKIPKYQAIANEIAALGVEPTKDLLLQTANNNLAGLKKAYEATLTGTVGDIKRALNERESVPESKTELNVNPNKDESTFHLKSKDLSKYEYAGDLKLLQEAIEKLNSNIGVHVDLDYVVGPAMNPEYITVENGKVLITEETYKQIVDEHFTIRANTKSQLEAYEKALAIQDQVNDLMKRLWKNDDERNQAEFADLFQFDENGQYQFDPTTLEHF